MIEHTGDDTEIVEDDYTLRVSGDFAVVGDRWMPLWFEATFHQPLEPVIFARVELRDGIPRVVELSWRSPPGHREIMQKDLRETVVASVVENGYSAWIFTVGYDDKEAVISLVGSIEASGDIAPDVLHFIDSLRSPGKRRIDTKFLTEVARVYRENVDHAPTEAVARTFGVKHRMASNYVSKARERGLLPQTKQGRAKA